MNKAAIRPASYWVDCPNCGEAITRGMLGFNKEDEIRFEEDELATIVNGLEVNCNECNEWFKVEFNA